MRPKPRLRIVVKTPPVAAPARPKGRGFVMSSMVDDLNLRITARKMNRDRGEELESDGVPLRAWVPNFISRWF